MTWLSLVLTPFLVAIGTLFLWTILSEMHEHTMHLYGRAISASPEQWVRVRLAVQNGEDVPLDAAEGGAWRIRITVGGDGKFCGPPKAFLGPRPLYGGTQDGQKTFEVDFDVFRASDTWVFECEVDQRATSVTLQLLETRDRKVEPRRLRRLSVSELTVDLNKGVASEADVRGAAFLPSAAFGTSSLGTLVFIYFGVIRLFGSDAPGAAITSLHQSDWFVAAVMVCIGIAMFRFVQRTAPPMIQGFSEETHILPRPSVVRPIVQEVEA
jgi:hypothetical protein